MISIFVCFINESYLNNLKTNISATIGCVYELIAIDNRNSGKGICQVYNEAATQAKYDILCFLHEDVIFHTHSWGNILVELIASKEVGLVGISGAVYKSKYPATWSACEPSLYRSHSIQHFKNKSQPVTINQNPGNEAFSEVAVLDGVFLATRKDVFKEFKFDEELFKGFHAYDLDYSLQVSCKYKVVVSFNILLEHFSEGNLTKSWYYDSLALHKKWAKILPKKASTIDDKLQKYSNYLSCQSVLQQVIQNNLGVRRAFYYFSKLITSFFAYNGLKYSKTILLYILSRLTLTTQ